MDNSKRSKKTVRAVVMAAVIGIAAIAVLVANLFIPLKYLSAYLIWSYEALPENSARITFVDVGYGDCTIVELPDGKIMLIDGGDGRYSHQLTVLKELNRRRIDTIDYLVCTSVKDEHCGGLSEIMEYKTVKKIYSPYCLKKYITDGYEAFSEARSAVSDIADNVYIEYGVGESEEDWSFRFLSPTVLSAWFEGAEYYDLDNDPTDENINRASAVMWLNAAGAQFLFLSDTTAEICSGLVLMNEVNDLQALFGVDLSACSVLTAAMHGGEDGVYTPLYELVQPEYTVISVGDNGESAPSNSALAAAGCGEIYRTDKNGTVVMTVSEGKITVSV